MSPVPGWDNTGRGYRAVYNPRTGGHEYFNALGQSVLGAPDMQPRVVRRLLANASLAQVILLGQPMLGFTASGTAIVAGGRANVNSTVPAPTFSIAGDGNGLLRYLRIRRSGGGSKERIFCQWGAMPFHHIVDPTGAQAGWSMIWQDLVCPVFTSGHAWLFWGFGSFNTATDETSRVGAFWQADDVNACWTSGVWDGVGTPSTQLHKTVHAGLTFDLSNPHRLAIEIEAVTKTINFYANGALVDSYTPVAPLAQMTNCPQLTYYGITETGADASIYTFGGYNPRLLVLVPTD